MKNKKEALNWLLLVIIVTAAFLRLWKLGSVPPHLTPDEAALGYNAFSILKTGKDEYGKIMPIIFKSFGDFKPGLYVYLTVPFVAFLGLNEFTVRLASALAGIGAVWLVYKITLLLFKGKKLSINRQTLAIVASFLLAISPWHIHFSRGAWEANVALTLTLAGIYFFLRSFYSSRYLILSAVFFASTYLTYQGAKLATTIPVVILSIIYWREIIKFKKRELIKAVIVGLVICTPIFASFLQGKTGRLGVFSVFSYPRPAEYLQEFLDQGQEKVGGGSYYLFHPEALNFTRGIMGRWFNHFSGRFLFFEGDWQNARHAIPNQGTLLVTDILFLIIGAAVLIKAKSKGSFFVFLWLVFSPLPAALSRDQVHAVRSFNMVIPLVIILSFGLTFVVDLIKRIRLPILHATYYMLLSIVYLAGFVYFLDAYFVHLPKHNSKFWYYGYKQAVQAVSPKIGGPQKIVFQQSYDQPYIYFLFFLKYDPAAWQKQAKLTESEVGDVGLVEEFENVAFRKLSWPISGIESGSLVVADDVVAPKELIAADYKVLTEIKYPGGKETALRVLEKK